MRLRFLTQLLLLLTVNLITSCSSQPSSPIPSDQSLIDKLVANEDLFQSFITDTENQENRDKIGCTSVRVVSKDPPKYYCIVWEKDLVGPGGYAKGYYYSQQFSGNLVEGTDEYYINDPAASVNAFRHIKGPWYIYYWSDN